MYETVKMYEKEAARLKEEAARNKLEAAAAKYEESRQPVKKKKKKKKTKQQMDQAMEDAEHAAQEEDADESEEESDEEDQQPVSLADRRAAKLAEFKKEDEESKKEEQRQEQLRAQLLGDGQKSDEEMDLGPSLIKKRRRNDEESKVSLIANITSNVTPPHDFSKKLEIKAWEGTVLFPRSKEDGSMWTPPESAFNPNDEALSFELDGFDLAKAKTGKVNNTIAIKYTAPVDSKRFSINIAGPDNHQYDSVLFHFNPRQFEKGGQLVLNNKKEGMWGQAVNVPLSRIPIIFGEKSSTVVFQIHEDGFDVYIEDKHCARLEHREVLKSGGKLHLQFPATDDRGNPEKWSLYKVWWGHKKIMAKEDLGDVYGVNAFVGMHPKKLFIKGLAAVKSEAEVDLRRAQLERAFRKYGGDQGVLVTVPTNATFAFVECDTEQMANLALEEMADGEYDIKRARRKRHEALQEQRAAAQQGKENTEWD